MVFTGHPNEDFLVPSQNYSNALPFCTRTSSWSGGVIDIFHAKNVLLLGKVYSSQIYEAEAGLENAQFSLVSKFTKLTLSPPYLRRNEGNSCWPKTVDDWWKETYTFLPYLRQSEGHLATIIGQTPSMIGG